VKRSVSLPLQALMVGWGDVAEGHQGYAHSIAFFVEEGVHVLEQWVYIGITSRNWLERMEEHLQEMRSGSNKRFHAAWRAYAGNSRLVLCSELIVLTHWPPIGMVIWGDPEAMTEPGDRPMWRRAASGVWGLP